MLHITINSFSFKRGIPYDPSGHGGGFVFDCRGLPNPGRLDAYKQLTGNDQPVIDYLNDEPNAAIFLEAISRVVSVNINNYLERGHDNLSINFGCTGGQHRSVYCANAIAEFVRTNFSSVLIKIKHLELKIEIG